MTEDLAAFLFVIVLGVWLGSLLLGVEKAVAVTQAKIRSVKRIEARLRGRIDKAAEDEGRLTREIETLMKSLQDARTRHDTASRKLSEIERSRRQRLYVLSQRRQSGDGDWVVKMANHEGGRHGDPGTGDRGDGREYLVWARTLEDANHVALRRLGMRTGNPRVLTTTHGGLFADHPEA